MPNLFYVRCRAEQMAIQENPEQFYTLHRARALAFRTPAMAEATYAYDSFMTPYRTRAVNETQEAYEEAQAAFAKVIEDKLGAPAAPTGEHDHTNLSEKDAALFEALAEDAEMDQAPQDADGDAPCVGTDLSGMTDAEKAAYIKKVTKNF